MTLPQIPAHILQNPDRKAVFEQMRSWVKETLQPSSIQIEDTIPTGATSLDRELGGGYAPGRITEIVEPVASRGVQSLIHHAVAQARRRQQYIALVDTPNHFDPQSESTENLQSLLWVRTTRASEVVQACDILIRDGNFPLLLIDLRLPAHTRRHFIRPAQWYRLQHVCEQSRIAFAAFTAESMIPCAHFRLQLTQPLSLAMFDPSANHVLPGIECEVLKRRLLPDTDAAQPACKVANARA